MNAGELLNNTLSPDQATRQAAEQQLERASIENYPAYVTMLAAELANEASPAHIRNAAGLAVKNALAARDPTRQEEYAQRWITLAVEARQEVKGKTFSTLGSQDARAGHVSAQVIAAIAAIELPCGLWNDLISQLTAAMSDAGNTRLRQAVLQTIGFTCESSVSSEVLSAQSNEILTAVIQGARKEETSPEVQLSALQALHNSLEFVKANFEREGERNYIMQVICEATQSADVKIKVAAFECLVQIMHLYYDKMRFYMEQALFGLTVLGMRDPEPHVAMQAIEFWSTVCEEELDLIMEAEDAREYGEEPSRPCHGFARIALPEILPVLMDTLRMQDEDTDDDEWTVSKAAGAAVGLLAEVTTDEMVPLAIPFIEQHIKSADWSAREAAVMCFGSILSGPDQTSLAPLVEQALPTIIEMLQDPSTPVKDTASWTLGRITDMLCQTIKPEILPILIQALVVGLNDDPRVAMNCSWALMNLCEQLGGGPLSQADGIALETSLISPYFEGIVTSLLAASDRPTNEGNARASAYEALGTAVGACPQDCLPHVSNVVVSILDRQSRLNGMAAQLVGMDDKNNWAELQTNLCSVLQAIMRRLGQDIAPLGDQIMTGLLTTIQSAGKQSAALEDAFMAVGAFATAREAGFENYLPAFNPFLQAALRDHSETMLLKTAVGIVGDVCRALGKNATSYAEAYMTALTEAVQSPSLGRDVKPVILSAFGDIALATGENFAPYLPNTMATLAQAVQSATPSVAVEWSLLEFFATLRESSTEAYAGIVAGIVADNRPDLLQPYVESIFSFIGSVAALPTERTEQLLRSSLGLLGDICAAYQQGQLKPLLEQGWVAEFIRAGRSKAVGVDTRRVASWARDQVRLASA